MQLSRLGDAMPRGIIDGSAGAMRTAANRRFDLPSSSVPSQQRHRTSVRRISGGLSALRISGVLLCAVFR